MFMSCAQLGDLGGQSVVRRLEFALGIPEPCIRRLEIMIACLELAVRRLIPFVRGPELAVSHLQTVMGGL
jgi:hypothetical protein